MFCGDDDLIPLDMIPTCKENHRKLITTRVSDAKRLGVPFILPEFGACSDSLNCALEIRALTESADESVVGWAYWSYKEFNDPTTVAGDLQEGLFHKNGSLQQLKMKELSRTSVQASQGSLLSQSFNSTTGDF